MTRVLNTDPSLNRVTLASNACRVKEPVSVRESWSLHIKPIEWMGELGELGGRGSVPSETFCPPFNSRYKDGASYTHVKSCDGFFSFFWCVFVSQSLLMSLCVPPHLQGSWRRKLGHRRLPNAHVNYCPHQMPVQQDIHLHRVSAAS